MSSIRQRPDGNRGRACAGTLRGWSPAAASRHPGRLEAVRLHTRHARASHLHLPLSWSTGASAGWCSASRHAVTRQRDRHRGFDSNLATLSARSAIRAPPNRFYGTSARVFLLFCSSRDTSSAAASLISSPSLGLAEHVAASQRRRCALDRLPLGLLLRGAASTAPRRRRPGRRRQHLAPHRISRTLVDMVNTGAAHGPRAMRRSTRRHSLNELPTRASRCG